MMNERIALFTDIHFGKKNNSTVHNTDCLDFVSWFCNKVVEDGKIDKIIFMGDWFENRNAVNILTLNYAHSALQLLNLLNIPIYIIIGNHDLYHREARSVFSTQVFDEFSNVTLINEPTEVDGYLICPYLFKDEYKDLVKYNHLKYWFGHFEFRNFVVTGSDRRMEHGPDHTQFGEPIWIFSGHFHKRQIDANVVYIGNTFPMDYGDSWDDARGMCIVNTSDGDLTFIDWEECPKYRRLKLSDVLSDTNLVFPTKCRVKCLIDVDISYSDAQALKEEFTKNIGLREFILEENLQEKKDSIAGEELDTFDISSLNDAVIKMLQTGVTNTTTINANKLIEIYTEL